MIDLLAICLSFVALILTIRNRERIYQLEAKLDQAEAVTLPASRVPPTSLQPVPYEQSIKRPIPAPQPSPLQPLPQTAASPLPASPSISLERLFGGRLAIWGGGIALALAGFFLVRYSIEAGLLSPLVRVILSGGFGFALLAAGIAFRRQGSGDRERIAQALYGAGIADLYGTLVAASTLYHLIPGAAAFLCMAGLTGFAIVSSLRHGAPIAVLGMVGGFMAPLLVHTDHPNTALLFGYLYLVFAGLLLAAGRAGWPRMAQAAMTLAFTWAAFWLGVSFQPGETPWVNLYLLSVPLTVIALRDERQESSMVLGIALPLMAATVFRGHFAAMDMALYALLSGATIVLTLRQPARYRYALWAATGVAAALLASADHQIALLRTIAIPVFASAFAGTAGLLTLRLKGDIGWARLSVATPCLYFMVGWLDYGDLQSGGLAGASALAIAAGIAVFGGYADAAALSDRKGKQALRTLFAAAVMLMATLGLILWLPVDWLPLAFSLEILAMAALEPRLDIEALRPLMAVLTGGIVLILLQQFFLLALLALHSVIGDIAPDTQAFERLLFHPVLRLGAPAMVLLAASVVMRRHRDDAMVQVLEGLFLCLAILAGYYLQRQCFGNAVAPAVEAGFLQRGILTNLLLATGLGSFCAGKTTARTVIRTGGTILFAMGLFRIVWFDLLLRNPLFVFQDVGEFPVLNSLLVTFGLPILWIGALAHARRDEWSRVLSIVQAILLFILVTMAVRQAFHGSDLTSGSTSDPEIYAYSAAWLGIGFVLLVWGLYRGSKDLRIAALSVMVATVSKACLYDAGTLTGLLRVASFLALGFCLLGLGWFYTRFVFPKENAADHSPGSFRR